MTRRVRPPDAVDSREPLFVPALVAALALPAAASLEAADVRPPAVHEVRTAVEIDAPPERR